MLCVLLVVFSPIASAAKMYKWVDENGDVRYSDRLPVQQSKEKHETLNSQGIVVETKEAAKSENELRAEKKAAEKEKERLLAEKKIADAQAKKDRVLLLTFSSEEELSLVRDNRIQVLESVINLIEKSIATTQEKLNEFESKADANYRSKNLEVPGGLAQNIEHFTRKVANRTEQLKLKMDERHKIIMQYNEDIQRYRKLKEQQDP